MKVTLLPPRFLLAAAFALSGALHAAETAAPAEKKHGYTVTVDVKVAETGEKETLKITSTDDTTTGNVLNKMAVAMAMKADLPPREKNGKKVKYTARMPFFFPIEGDEGPEANALPIPRPRSETAFMPAYPATLRDGGVVGGAILELLVDAEGKLTQLTTLRASHPDFEAAATEAVRKWTFKPAEKDGQPVASRSRLAIVFETEETMADLRWRVPPRPMLGSFFVIRPSSPISEDAAAPATEPAAAPAAEPAPATKP